VDTAFFRGNYPARCSLKGASPGADADIVKQSASWTEILPAVALGPDQLQVFESQLCDAGPVTHVRLDIYPDGGVARLRLPAPNLIKSAKRISEPKVFIIEKLEGNPSKNN